MSVNRDVKPFMLMTMGLGAPRFPIYKLLPVLLNNGRLAVEWVAERYTLVSLNPIRVFDKRVPNVKVLVRDVPGRRNVASLCLTFYRRKVIVRVLTARSEELLLAVAINYKGVASTRHPKLNDLID